MSESQLLTWNEMKIIQDVVIAACAERDQEIERLKADLKECNSPDRSQLKVMTREQAKELLPVIQAFAEGAIVEYLCTNGQWSESGLTSFDPNMKWRIKPKPLECWVQATPEGKLYAVAGSAAVLSNRQLRAGWRNVKMREVLE